MAKRTARDQFPRRSQDGNVSPRTSTAAFVSTLGKRPPAQYQLRLYIAGASPRSSRAIANVRRICEEHLAGRYDLEVVDLYQHPVLSRGEQIVAVPTLIKRLPAPLRKFIGDMSDTDRILVGLDLKKQ